MKVFACPEVVANLNKTLGILIERHGSCSERKEPFFEALIERVVRVIEVAGTPQIMNEHGEAPHGLADR